MLGSVRCHFLGTANHHSKEVSSLLSKSNAVRPTRRRRMMVNQQQQSSFTSVRLLLSSFLTNNNRIVSFSSNWSVKLSPRRYYSNHSTVSSSPIRPSMLETTSSTSSNRNEFISDDSDGDQRRRATLSSSVNKTNSNPRNTMVKQSTVKLYSSLSLSNNDNDETNSRIGKDCMDYSRGWAWQNLLLQRRLDWRRRHCRPDDKEQPQKGNNDRITNSGIDGGSSNDENVIMDEDIILIFEHSHVYTLGRGADENYLSFLSNNGGSPNNNASDAMNIRSCSNIHDDNNGNDIHGKNDKLKLSRTSRGPGSSRLCMGRQRYVTANDCDETIDTIVNQLFPYEPAKKQQHHGQWNDSSYDDNDEKVCIKINSNDNNDNNKHLGIIPVIAPNGVPIYRVERGGEVTYHGPGQVVVYPLFDLQQQQREHEKQLVFKPDLHWYIRTLEQIIIDTLQVYNIIGYRDDINTGVWVTEDDAETKDHQSSSNAIYEHRNKIAAIGVSSSRWITTHGFAINVCPDLQYFDTSNIIPCGISHTDPSDDGNAANETEWLSSCPTNTKKKKIRRGVTSIANILRKRGVCESDIPTTQQVSEDIVRNIQTTFQVNIEYCRFVK